MRYLFTLGILSVIIAGCSPAKLLQKAIERGAKVQTDTVFTELITDRTITDTVTRFQTINKILSGDTITLETIRWKSKTVIDTLTRTIYQQVECKPDTIRVPISVTTEISAGYSKWQLIGSILAVLIIIGLAGYLFMKTKS